MIRYFTIERNERNCVLFNYTIITVMHKRRNEIETIWTWTSKHVILFENVLIFRSNWQNVIIFQQSVRLQNLNRIDKKYLPFLELNMDLSLDIVLFFIFLGVTFYYSPNWCTSVVDISPTPTEIHSTLRPQVFQAISAFAPFAALISVLRK